MKQMYVRIAILRLLATFVVALLLYNLFHIQVIEGQKWANVADNNRFRHLVQTAPRGNIFTADGVELASNIPGYEVALAYEQDRVKRELTVIKLAELLKMDEVHIFEKLDSHRRRFEPVIIATRVDFETVLLLEEHRHLMPSLVIQISPQRVYTQNTLLSHSLGRVNIDGLGTEGLEKQWESYLRGENGFSVIQVNAAGRPVDIPVNSKSAIPGNDLHLTIDAGLQQVAQDSLHRVLEKMRETHKMENAWTGAVVVMDPNTGKILAIATEPSFDNNIKGELTTARNNNIHHPHWPEELPLIAQSLRDRAINWRKPVGSTFKMLVGLAALETNHVTKSEKINDTGIKFIDNFRTRNYGSRAYGNIDMRRALEVSSNIYFGTIGSRMGRELIYEYINIFGMSGSTISNPETTIKNAGFDDIAIGEQRSSVDAYKERMVSRDPYWRGGDTVQISYGQFNEYTPLQMGNYVSMLANGGIHYRPYMVEKITDANGELVEFFEPEVLNIAEFNPANLKVIQEGMKAAASGGQFRNLPFSVAGKTGTAEEGGGNVHSWWVGYAPYDNPEIAIVVFMENAGLGSRSTEVARDIIDYYFGLN